MVARRQFGLGFCATVGLAGLQRRALADQNDLRSALMAIEVQCGGQLGVGILDTATGALGGYRGNESFPICSTYKVLSAAAILHRVGRGEERLDRRIHFGTEEVLPYSPATKAHAGEDGMTLAAICEAAITLSDNTAANLMFAAVGGPAGVTAFLRETGDQTTRLDRTEPTLNEARPGDQRDTTSPFAMAATLQRLVLGDALLPALRSQLAEWLVAGRTGATRLRAGVPAGWKIGEKTGTNDIGTANDIGVLWPPGRPPLVVTAFVTASTAPSVAQDAAIAAVAHLVAARA